MNVFMEKVSGNVSPVEHKVKNYDSLIRVVYVNSVINRKYNYAGCCHFCHGLSIYHVRLGNCVSIQRHKII